MLAEYATLVLKSDWIKSEDDLITFQKKRESFIEMINNSQVFFSFIDSELTKWNFGKHSGDFEHYDKELKMIGIDFVSAEGMLTGFTTAPVLEDVISRVASWPYRLYIQMKEAYAESYGSEYTYYDLMPEMKAIHIGEQLLELYPDSKYAELAGEILSDALFPLTDYHRMLGSPDDPQASNTVDEREYLYIVGELYTHVFPWWTDISEPRKFIELYPDSRFKDVIEKIANNPSEVHPGSRVFVVAIDRFTDEKSARKAVLSCLLKGLDIPHVLTVGGGNYVVAYRFFASSDKAQKALEEIKSIKPEAYTFFMLPSVR